MEKQTKQLRTAKNGSNENAKIQDQSGKTTKGTKGFQRVDDPRYNSLAIRFNDSELLSLKKLSEFLGLSLSETIRYCLNEVYQDASGHFTK